MANGLFVIAIWYEITNSLLTWRSWLEPNRARLESCQKYSFALIIVLKPGNQSYLIHFEATKSPRHYIKAKILIFTLSYTFLFNKQWHMQFEKSKQSTLGSLTLSLTANYANCYKKFIKNTSSSIYLKLNKLRKVLQYSASSITKCSIILPELTRYQTEAFNCFLWNVYNRFTSSFNFLVFFI